MPCWGLLALSCIRDTEASNSFAEILSGWIIKTALKFIRAGFMSAVIGQGICPSS